MTSPILSLEQGASDEHELTLHSHPEPKLLWIRTATVLVRAGDQEWLVPPGYGLWIPGGVDHEGSVLRGGQGSAIAFDPATCPITWTRPTGVAGGPLLRELIAYLFENRSPGTAPGPAEALLFDLITPLPPHEIQLRMPADPRARAVAERLVADPADPRDLAAWADHTHTGLRTLSRLFRDETGLSFARWRTQVRVRTAVSMLGSGVSVDAVARHVGYRKTSAFIVAFRRVTGQTPGTYRSR